MNHSAGTDATTKWMMMNRPSIFFTSILLFTIISCDNKASDKKVSSVDSVERNGAIRQPARIIETKDVEYAYPHWSVDGKRILFQSNITGRWHIYIMDDDGNNLAQITNDSSNNNFPDWSPDNDEICFVSDKTGNEEIYVMDSNGENKRQLTFDNARDIHPYWAPDGRKILFSSTRDDQGDFEIYEMNADGSSLRRMTYTGDNETCARYGPMLKRMVYLKNNSDGLDDLFLMDLNDGTEVNLTNTPTRDGWPSWMPGGEEVLFSAVEDDRYKLFIYNIRGKSTRRLTDPPINHDDGRAHVSADGRKIVFNRQLNGKKNTIGIYVLYLR